MADEVPLARLPQEIAAVLPARLDWASVIGNFLLNFGTLQYLVVGFLKNNLEAAEFEKLRDKHFNDQVKRVEQHLHDSSCSTEERENLANLFRRLDSIRVFRNHVAHGHLTVRADIEAKAWMMSITLPKHLDLEYSPETRHLTFPELRARLNDLTEFCEEFKRLGGWKPGWAPE